MANSDRASASGLRRRAVGLLGRGDFHLARDTLQQALALDPDHPGALSNLGAARRALGDLPGAITCYRKALALDPESAALGFNLANALKESGCIDEAIAVYEQVITAHPTFLRAMNNLGLAYKQAGRSEAAGVTFRRALQVDAAYGAALRNLAAIHEDNGDFTAARRCYYDALANDPEDAKALSKIIASKSEVAPQDCLDRAESLLRGDKISGEGRAQLHYGLGKFHDRAGNADRALPHFREANGLKARKQPFSGDAVANRVQRICAAFTDDVFTRFQDARHATQRPVLIVGMPRTGTTLAEQILSSHPRIAGGGELPYFGSVALGFAARTGLSAPFPEAVSEFRPDIIDKVAAPYLAELERISPDADRVTDKMPQNFLYLGLVALLFSNARIIHCWRDPRDVCLSCFVEDFDAAHGFASDARHFLEYYRQYCRLMQHWRRVLPLPVYDLRYEDLVGNFEPTVAALLDFVGCDWDAACLRYYEQDRTISTPSRWQVRQPIYTNSIGRWRRYSDYLAPVLQELSELAAAGAPGKSS